jgi:hypothetical protein
LTLAKDYHHNNTAEKPDGPFSLRNILRREYNTLLPIVVVVGFLLEFFGDWFDTRRIAITWSWCVFLPSGTVIWACLRTLKRYSAILDIEGR